MAAPHSSPGLTGNLLLESTPAEGEGRGSCAASAQGTQVVDSKLSILLLGHDLATDDADLRVAIFTAWWRVARPAYADVARRLEFIAE